MGSSVCVCVCTLSLIRTTGSTRKLGFFVTNSNRDQDSPSPTVSDRSAAAADDLSLRGLVVPSSVSTKPSEV